MPENTEAPKQADPAPAAQPPPVNVEAMVKGATEAATNAAIKIAEETATKMAAEKLKNIGRSLSGEAPEDPKKKILQTFVDDPAKTLRVMVDVAKNEMKEEAAQKDAVVATQRQVMNPMIDEYPELKSPKKLALVEKLASDYQSSGMSYADALKKAGEDTVKEFGLKSVSEAQRDGSYRNVGLPGGGGMSPGAPRFDEGKSQNSFLQGLKEKHASFRTKRISSAK